MHKFIEVLPDKTSLISRALSLTVEKIKSAIERRGQCTLALSGGSTPKPLYEALAEQSLPWEKIHIFWGDERYVAVDHPDSNQLMARQAWLDKISIPAANIHPMPTGAQNPAQDAQTHEMELTQFFKVKPGDFPAFDVILLGMGDDAHTASLFPQTDALKVNDRLITVGNKDGQPRLTFTLPLINQAHCVIFLVAGESKRPALAQVFAEVASETIYPSRSIQPQGELFWLFDQAAGAELKV
ncbi:6-phosphogluconolactonase [Aphanothece sacrum]|uniref:6-phosphogluconolactonase n=1 Tax=Aphanothece sacrum FPU1 TaxID=1920663 RepID=A0A401IJ33_APHSA|nr:6-phosphogluconolactonase [Aphanothece sacrum]GBF81297.1 6-phosphogluconolactonase [Aphanothece sacrum FPU1]GBF83353.1 6-phosphogluconolactonase [Aphanothece sacrum FPU3]